MTPAAHIDFGAGCRKQVVSLKPLQTKYFNPRENLGREYFAVAVHCPIFTLWLALLVRDNTTFLRVWVSILRRTYMGDKI